MNAKKARAKTSKRRAPGYSDDIVYLVLYLYLEEGLGATEITRRIEILRNISLRRETVHAIIHEGIWRKMCGAFCPLEQSKAEKIVEKYELSNVSTLLSVPQVQVANVFGDRALHEVARQAARSAHALILEIAQKKKELGQEVVVHIGFASGRTTRLVAQYLAEEIRRKPEGMPRLVLHALSSGFSADDPEAASVTFFSFFDQCPGKTSVGLFTQPFVPTDEWDYTIATPGIAESFKAAKDIDIVITSLAWAGDAHGEFMKFLKLTSQLDDNGAPRAAKEWHESQRRWCEERLRALGWIGDVQYQPFSDQGPIEIDIGYRALTLFTLTELMAMARTPNKAVLLVCGPCAVCGESRAEALAPLLANPALRVWSHVVMDLRTAERCLWTKDLPAASSSNG